MNVFDWLSTVPLESGSKPFPVIEVSFNQGSRKEYFKNNTAHAIIKGELVAVEGVGGFDVGQVSLTGELVKLQLKKYGIQDQSTLKRVLRPASPDDINLFEDNKLREKEIMIRSRAITKELKIDMKIGEVELQADGKKATFYYTAEQRVDFRELIKVFASDFKVKVEMRQIGARQESGKVGGIGSCGRELCCSTWLSDFKSVNTTAARYQTLSINQTKLSGQCGRLKCCLNYELDTYMDALKAFPQSAESIKTSQGTANLIKKDIFKNLMWYSYPGSSKQYPMTIERVTEIVQLNKQGIIPEELQAVELEAGKSKEKLKVDMGFVNDVGQLSLRSLEKKKSKNKSKNKQQAAPGKQGNAPQQAGPKKEGQQQEKGGGQTKAAQQPQQARQQAPKKQQQGGGNNNAQNPNPGGGNNNNPNNNKQQQARGGNQPRNKQPQQAQGEAGAQQGGGQQANARQPQGGAPNANQQPRQPRQPQQAKQGGAEGEQQKEPRQQQSNRQQQPRRQPQQDKKSAPAAESDPKNKPAS
jgi:cell fate regulator YaaT (PSP1 superfamily)